MTDTGTNVTTTREALLALFDQYADATLAGENVDHAEVQRIGAKIVAALATPEQAPAVQAEQPAEPRRLAAFSCAKQVADPANVWAACRQHCGNRATCIKSAPESPQEMGKDIKSLAAGFAAGNNGHVPLFDAVDRLVALAAALAAAPREQAEDAQRWESCQHPDFSHESFTKWRELPSDGQYVYHRNPDKISDWLRFPVPRASK
jgi:hypothetical protein